VFPDASLGGARSGARGAPAPAIAPGSSQVAGVVSERARPSKPDVRPKTESLFLTQSALELKPKLDSPM
jgi:hypothetical protein